MQQVYEVPREEWPHFCRRFLEEHQNEVVSLEVFDHEGGGQQPQVKRRVAEHNAFLRDMLIERTDGESQLTIETESGPRHRSHHIVLNSLSRLQLEQTQSDSGGVLRTESKHGQSMLITFSQPVFPGVLDGLP